MVPNTGECHRFFRVEERGGRRGWNRRVTEHCFHVDQIWDDDDDDDDDV